MFRKLIAAAVLIWAISPLLNAQRWDPPARISPGWNTHEIAFDSTGRLYLVSTGNNVARSNDGGKAWTAGFFGVPMQAANPDVAVDAHDRVYIVFQGIVEGRWQLYLTTSSDQGQTWSPPSRIAYTAKDSQWPRVLATGDGSLHVIWHDLVWPPYVPRVDYSVEYYHMKSTDGGANWTTPALITSGSGGWTLAATADPQSRLYAAWSYCPASAPCGAYLYRSSDGGVGWSHTKLANGATNPALALDASGALHVIMTQGTEAHQFNLLYMRGDNGGSAWTAPQVVGAGQGPSNYNPDGWCTLAADAKQNLLMAYQDRSSGNHEIYFRRSPNGGKDWLDIEQVTNTSAESLQPSLFVGADSTVHVVWNEVVTGGFDLYYRRLPLRGN